MNTFLNVKNLILIALFILTALAFQIDKRSGNNRILEINLSLKTDSIYFKINHSKGYYVRGKKSGYWILDIL